MLSVLRLQSKQKNSPNPFRIPIFLFLSYSFRIKTINTSIHSRSSLENHTRFQTKMGKVYIRVFRPKRRKNPTRWGSTYLYSLSKGVLPPRSHYSKLIILPVLGNGSEFSPIHNRFITVNAK